MRGGAHGYVLRTRLSRNDRKGKPRMRPIALSALPALLALGLAGCVPPPEPTSWPDIRFTDKPPIRFDVAKIVIETPYIEPIDPPHVGEQFPVSPTRAARNWAEDRLRAVGRRGTLTVTIRESGAVEERLEPSTGLKALFTKEQTERYTVTIDVSVKALDPVGPRSATATARTRKSTTVREDATLDEREQIWYDLTKDTMADFDSAMTRQIRSALADFLAP